jgi:hypothetical protein
VAQTQALDRLAAISAKLHCHVHLAVIPALAETSLVNALQDRRTLVPMVHGWRHENHAPADAKKAEFGHSRPNAVTEINRAMACLAGLFPDTLAPVFVPPWNRFDKALAPALCDAGFAAISAYMPRKQAELVPGLVQINTHVDPIDWRGTRGLIDPDLIVARAGAHLEARMQGTEDNQEPFGLLTHHLVHVPEVWQFTENFVARMLDGGARNTPLMSLLETSK